MFLFHKTLLRNDGPAIAATFLGEFLNAILDVEDQIPGTLDPSFPSEKWGTFFLGGTIGKLD